MSEQFRICSDTLSGQPWSVISGSAMYNTTIDSSNDHVNEYLADIAT